MAILDWNESRNQILARLGEIGKLTPDTMFGELSRRNFMALGASAGIGLGSISTSALAKAAKLRVQAPYWYRFNVGEAEITVVSDGWQMLGDPSNSFLGVPKDEVRKDPRAGCLQKASRMPGSSARTSTPLSSRTVISTTSAASSMRAVL